MTREEILPIAKPILFNTDMVQAILDGKKTETRRLIKPPYFVDGDEDDSKSLQVLRTASKSSALYKHIGEMPYPGKRYKVGDYLYVRETWCNVNKPECEPDYYYFADTRICEDYRPSEWTWRPSIHMPKEAARIFLRVTDVRVERLQDIGDCTKEGVKPGGHATAHMNDYDERCAFKQLWDSTIKHTDLYRYGWHANPWVWVIEFERAEVQ